MLMHLEAPLFVQVLVLVVCVCRRCCSLHTHSLIVKKKSLVEQKKVEKKKKTYLAPKTYLRLEPPFIVSDGGGLVFPIP